MRDGAEFVITDLGVTLGSSTKHEPLGVGAEGHEDDHVAPGISGQTGFTRGHKDTLSTGLHPRQREEVVNGEEAGWWPQAITLNLKTENILGFSPILCLQTKDIQLAC